MDQPAAADFPAPCPSPSPGPAPTAAGLSEDWWAVIIGGLLLALALAAPLVSGTISHDTKTGQTKIVSAIKPYIAKPSGWQLPHEIFARDGALAQAGIVGAMALLLLATAPAVWRDAQSGLAFLRAAPIVMGMAAVAYLMAEQAVVKSYGLESALWALLLGLVVSNTVGTPNWLKAGTRTELFIKTGLVLLGAEVLLGKLLVLGIPGICVAWIVTPIVLITTYWFGQRVLGVESKTLNIVIAADMSVCGVSAAIATAAACRAKKEELSLAVGMSMAFTVVMMVALPAVIRAMGLSQAVGGAWLGGTIDSTGAVAAAGTLVGPQAEEVAVTVKMIQNILIGFTAFGVAVYWVRYVDAGTGARPNAWEIWHRFPKFVIGFAAASIVFSLLREVLPDGDAIIESAIDDCSKTLRGWLFSLAFVCIGLETNFRQLLRYVASGRPFVLYLCGQTLNLILTLAMAKLMFDIIFRDMVQEWLNR